MKKLTYVDVLDKILNHEVLSDEEMSKVEALRDSVANRNSKKSSAPTKTQKENAVLRNDILTFIERGQSYSIKDIRCGVDSLSDATSQKIAPLMNSMVEEGILSKSIVKGTPYYTLVVEG